MPDALTYAFIGNLTKSRDEQGFLHIKGLASDDTLDLDDQICDPEWLKSAMPQWFKVGNIREMHGMNAAGKATAMTQKGTGFEIEGVIVDPLAATKVDQGVYPGLSIGIKGARVDRSEDALKRAPNGVIVGGRIVEVSLVDLPANPSAVLELVKTVGDVTEKTEVLGDFEDIEKGEPYKPVPYKRDADETVQCPKCERFNDRDAHFCDQCGFKLDGATDVEVKAAEPDPDCETCGGTGKIKEGNVDCPDCVQGKAVVPTKKQDDLPDSDFAYIEPGGKKDDEGKTVPRSLRHFLIKDAAHTRNALSRAPQSPFGKKAMPKILAAAKKFGITVSKGVESVLVKAADDEQLHNPVQLAEIRTLLSQAIEQELSELESGSDDEMNDLYQLLNALGIFLSWWKDEADEGETTEPFPDDTGDDTMAYVGLGVSADLIKSASAPDATDEVKSELRAEIVKALGLDGEIATKAELEELREANKSLEAALKDVREMAAPGQPALRATLEQQNKSAQADELTLKAARYRATAMQQTDKDAARQYHEAADALESQAKTLLGTTSL